MSGLGKVEKHGGARRRGVVPLVVALVVLLAVAGCGIAYFVMQGAAAVMSFDEVKVNRIVITLGEKFEEYDAMGNPNQTIVIPEIVCLGKEG